MATASCENVGLLSGSFSQHCCIAVTNLYPQKNSDAAHLHYTYTSDEQAEFSGASILSPFLNILIKVDGCTPPNGILPPQNISQHVTPNDHYVYTRENFIMHNIIYVHLKQ